MSTIENNDKYLIIATTQDQDGNTITKQIDTASDFALAQFLATEYRRELGKKYIVTAELNLSHGDGLATDKVPC